jgi:hypothetical protein
LLNGLEYRRLRKKYPHPGQSTLHREIMRKEIYDGRFFTVEMIGGKLQVPVASGMMKEENYQSMQIEGYDLFKKNLRTRTAARIFATERLLIKQL